MRIFLLGATPSFDLAAATTFEQRLSQTGGNAGNQIIAHGLLNTLVYDSVAWNYSVGPAFVRDNYDMVVVAAANFLFPGFDFGPMASFIEQARLPVAIVGLGAQSRDYSPKIALTPGTQRFVHVVAERTAKIGVRGPFTEQVLAEMGVHNVQVVGCPSYYLDGEAAPTPVAKAFEDVGRIAVSGSRDVISHAFDGAKMRRAIVGLVAEAMRYDGLFVAQTEVDEIALADNPDTPRAAAALERMAAFFVASGLDRARLESWARSRTRVYWSVDRWFEAMKSVDFVVGTRFHGAIAALVVGTPATIICHDTRTEEMSEFLAIPHVSIDRLERVDLRVLYESMDLGAMTARRRQLLPAYRRFLNENGLTSRV